MSSLVDDRVTDRVTDRPRDRVTDRPSDRPTDHVTDELARRFATATRASMETLEEDEYTARLETIIERDYFPELRRDRARVKLLRALEVGDANAVREIQRELARERAEGGGSRGKVVGTPSMGCSGTTSVSRKGVSDAEASWGRDTPRRRGGGGGGGGGGGVKPPTPYRIFAQRGRCGRAC